MWDQAPLQANTLVSTSLRRTHNVAFIRFYVTASKMFENWNAVYHKEFNTQGKHQWAAENSANSFQTDLASTLVGFNPTATWRRVTASSGLFCKRSILPTCTLYRWLSAALERASKYFMYAFPRGSSSLVAFWAVLFWRQLRSHRQLKSGNIILTTVQI